MKLHQRKLDEIRNRTSDRVDHTEPMTRKVLKKIRKHPQRTLQERIDSVQKENILIVDRLSRISSVDARYKRSLRKLGPASLNFQVRKLEAQRISDENQALVKRLCGVSPVILRKNYLKEYLNPESIKEEVKRNLRKKLSPLNGAQHSSSQPELPVSLNLVDGSVNS